jgi:type IV secretory pathway ATPase VirB11/archaellum biosynthesis ATPase
MTDTTKSDNKTSSEREVQRPGEPEESGLLDPKSEEAMLLAPLLRNAMRQGTGRIVVGENRTPAEIQQFLDTLTVQDWEGVTTTQPPEGFEIEVLVRRPKGRRPRSQP